MESGRSVSSIQLESASPYSEESICSLDDSWDDSPQALKARVSHFNLSRLANGSIRSNGRVSIKDVPASNSTNSFAEELAKKLSSMAYSLAISYEEELKTHYENVASSDKVASEVEPLSPEQVEVEEEVYAENFGLDETNDPTTPWSPAQSGATSHYSRTSRIGRYELRSTWGEVLATQGQRRIAKKNSARFKRTVTSQLLTEDIQDESAVVLRSDTCLGRNVTHPTSWKRFAWDILGITFMLYDTVIIPMQVFKLKWGTTLMVMGMVTLAYWTVDFGLSFLVGFYDRGVLEMRPHRIAVRYATTWMVLDFSVVALDWMLHIVTGGDTEGVGGKSAHFTRFAKTLRSLRVLRSLRLIRLVKLKHLLNEVQERINSEYVLIFLRMVKLIVGIALLNHFIACGWWHIGVNSDGWVSYGDFNQRSVGYCYTTSLHWSLTQFTPASMEIVPTNVYERTYAVCVLLFAMVIFSSFVSSITATMTGLRKLGSRLGKTKQFKMLRLYLKDNSVSWVLQVRIQKFLQYIVLAQKMHIPETSVELLAHLSTPLREELRLSILKPVLCIHPFFQTYYLFCPQALRQLCSYAVSPMTLSVCDLLFTNGEVSKAMYIMESGKLHYQEAQRGGMRAETDTNIILKDTTYLSELTLWTRWVHCGELIANANSKVLVLGVDSFANITKGHQTIFGSARRYAASVLAQVSLLERRSGINDLPLDTLDHFALLEDSFPSHMYGKKSFTQIIKKEEEEMDREWDDFQSRLHALARSVH